MSFDIGPNVARGVAKKHIKKWSKGYSKDMVFWEYEKLIIKNKKKQKLVYKFQMLISRSSNDWYSHAAKLREVFEANKFLVKLAPNLTL